MTEFSIGPLSDVSRLMADWRDLHARADGASFFLSPAWIDAWLHCRPRYTEIHVLRGSLNGVTVLLGAFGSLNHRRPPLIGARRIHLHETGDRTFDAVYVEHNDFLVATNAPAGIREAAVGAASGVFSKYDEIIFRNASMALARAVVGAANTARWKLFNVSRQSTFSVDLNGLATNTEDYLSRLRGSFGTQMRRSFRRYIGRGPLVLKIAESEQERNTVWKRLAALHEEGWRRRGKKGAFSNPKFVAFHRRLLRQASAQTQLVEVSCGDEVIGCLYNFVEAGRVMNYQSGFHFEDDNQLKPGFVTHILAMNHYAAQGYAGYDLLAGDADYKRRLAAEREALQTVALEKRGGFRGGVRDIWRGLRS